MRIVEIRETPVRLHSPVRNALVDFSQMTVSVVAVVSDEQKDGADLIGYGFNSIGRYAQSGLLRERFIPRLVDAPPERLTDEEGLPDPERIVTEMMRNEKPGGHGERSGAVAAVELAVWDLLAKARDVPMYALIAERLNNGRYDQTVDVYAAGGYYYPDDGGRRLRDEMAGYLDEGYTHLKIKVGGASMEEDLARIEEVLQLVPDGGRLAVDANGRFDFDTALAYGDAISVYGLRWFEEPGDPLDFALQEELARHYPNPFATGENLFSHQDVRNLIRHAGLRPDRDWLQMDPGLSYGLGEYVRMIEVVEAAEWSRRRVVPHGGHLMALHIAAGLGLGGNESYPGVFGPFGGFGSSVKVESGSIGLPDAPGAGLETKDELRPVLKELAE